MNMPNLLSKNQSRPSPNLFMGIADAPEAGNIQILSIDFPENNGAAANTAADLIISLLFISVKI
jgi:hypothetical protein